MIILPPLKAWEGSWAIVNRVTGECVYELHRSDAKLANRMNGEKYQAIGIAEYLASFNSGEGDISNATGE
jgi:hypothetical protein